MMKKNVIYLIAISSTVFCSASSVDLIDPATLSAYASSEFYEGGGLNEAILAVNGVGLVGEDHPCTTEPVHWISTQDEPEPWIVIDLADTYELDYMKVWNLNREYDWEGVGIRKGEVWTSSKADPNNPIDNPEKWTLLKKFTLNQAPGIVGVVYDYPDTISLDGVETRYLAITGESWYDWRPDIGLSEVQFFKVPIIDGYSPADEATNVPIKDIQLSWVLNDSTITNPQYHVYFGKDPDPNTIVSIQTETTYPTDSSLFLCPNINYYWKIVLVDAVSSEEIYESPILSFTTDGKADTPDPADGAIQVGQNSSLNWRAVNIDDVTYNVYFVQYNDPNNIPEFVGNFSTNSFTPAEIMDPDSAYAWKVDTVCDANVVEGDMWTFRTGGIVINPYPADGQSFAPTDITLSWTGDREGDTYVNAYDVYINDEFKGEVVDMSNCSWPFDGELDEDIAYTWRIDTKHDGQIITTGDTWSFTTGRLMGYWTLDTLDCIDEVAGNNGSILEGGTGKKEDPVIVPGPKGNAAYFNGTHFFKIASDPNYWLDSYKTLTVTAWIKWNPDDGNVAKGIVSKSSSLLPETGWIFGTYDHWSRVTFNLGGLDSLFWNPVNIVEIVADDQWHHIVYTWDGQKRYAYLDGERTLVQTDRWDPPVEEYGTREPDHVATEIAPSAASVGIGGSVDDIGLWASGFAGHIDDVRVYCRPLTQKQVQNLCRDSKMASQPSPANEESMVPWNTMLSWTPGTDDVTSQNIRIGKEEDLSDAVEITGLSADAGICNITAELGSNLELGTRYYWQVNTVTSSSDIFEGTIWWFAVRDLKPDLDIDQDVDKDDLGLMTGQWLDDSRSELAENFVWWDQEDWKTDGGDPNIQEYFESNGPPISGYSTITVNTNPQTDPNSPHDPGDQTVIYWFDMEDGGPDELEVSRNDAGFTWMLPPAQSHADFTPFDTLTIWMRKIEGDCTGSWFMWIGDQAGVPGGPITWHGDPDNSEGLFLLGSLDTMPSVFTEVEADLTGVNLSDVVGFSFGSWSAQGGSATLEISDFVLKSSGGENICWIGQDGQWTLGDINWDCDVNLSDFVLMAEAWLLDAN